jgi:hypothetical protein
LHGLDRDREKAAGKGSGVLGWISDPNTSEDQLVKEAQRLGARIPEKFAVKLLEAAHAIAPPTGDGQGG